MPKRIRIRSRNQGLAHGGAGSRGRKPESPVARVLRGAATFHELVKTLALQAPPYRDFKEAPDYLGKDGKAEYDRIVALIKSYDIDMFTELDFPALEVYCIAYDQMKFWARTWKRRPGPLFAKEIKGYLEIVVEMLRLLGMTPHSRFNLIDLRTLKTHRMASNPSGDTNYGRREFAKKTAEEKAELEKFVKSYNQAAKNFDGRGKHGGKRKVGPTLGEEKAGESKQSGWEGF